MTITGETRVVGVVGWPVAQSLSPVIHNAWIQALGLDAVYVAFAVGEAGFARWVDGLRAGGVRGLNVTMPHKRRALAAADAATGVANAAGGANTLLFAPDGRLVADSTDGRGVLAAFADQAPDWRATAGPVAIYGAGGAAAAAAAALAAAGAPQVRIMARDLTRVWTALAGVGDRVAVLAWDDPHALQDVSALINATSLGFLGAGGLEVSWGSLPPHAVVMDMVGAPLDTPLLQAARAHGHVAVDGLAMLIGQAGPSFASFFGVDAPCASQVDVRSLCLRAAAARATPG